MIFSGVSVLLGNHHLYAQILGYPLPGSINYPDSDGRRLGRIILENDSEFNALVADETSQIAWLASSSLDIPRVIRFDLSDWSKTQTVNLDNGIPAVLCGCALPNRKEVWFGSDGYMLIVDTEHTKIKSFFPAGNLRIVKILHDSALQRLVCLATGDTDCILTVDLLTGLILEHQIQGFSDACMDIRFSADNTHLYALTGASSSMILDLDTQDFSVENSVTIPDPQPAVAFVLNPSRSEVYASVSGSPAHIYRFTLPDLSPAGSLILEADERPRGFMTVDNSGNYLLINDGDATSGLVRINTVLFQRQDRLDFPGAPFPVCCASSEDSLLIATEHSPGTLIEIDTESLQILRQHEFSDNAGFANAMVCGLNPEKMFISVMNNNFGRIVRLDTDSGNVEENYNYPEVQGTLAFGILPGDASASYWIEDGPEPNILAIDLEAGDLLRRQSLPPGHNCIDLVYDDSNDSVLLLSDSTLFAIHPTSLEITDSLELATLMLPVKGMSLDSINHRLLIGGGVDVNQIWVCSSQPLAITGTIQLDPGERHVTSICRDDISEQTYMAVQSSPFKIKCFSHESNMFTGTVDLPFNGYTLRKLVAQPALGQLHVMDNRLPTTIYRLDIGTFDWLSPVVMNPNEYVQSCAGSRQIPRSIMSLSGNHAVLVPFGCSQADAIQGSWATLHEAAQIQRMNIYSHMDGNLIRLAVYDDAMTRLWESPDIINNVTDGWLAADIADGDPEALSLSEGQYFLAFQISHDNQSPSVTISSQGSGIRAAWPFEEFPPLILNSESTEAIWSMYADYLSIPGTPTPDPTITPTPESTDTPEPAPTSTPVVPTRTPQSTATGTPIQTPTPRPGSGVQLHLSGNLFREGDRFALNARVANMDPSPVDGCLFVILDVYGAYWFAPSWSESIDAYELTGLLGIQMLSVLQFDWPSVSGAAEGLVFWGGFVEQTDVELFGYYDRVEFGYRGEEPTATPWVTSTPTPDTTAEPSQTPTVTAVPCQIEIQYNENDPMVYSGEDCDMESIFCFSPERLNFCSDSQSIAVLHNAGSSSVRIDLYFEGEDAGCYMFDENQIDLPPGQSAAILIRFCPESPPDQLKRADIVAAWPGDSIRVTVKGWCVAG